MEISRRRRTIVAPYRYCGRIVFLGLCTVHRLSGNDRQQRDRATYAGHHKSHRIVKTVRCHHPRITSETWRSSLRLAPQTGSQGAGTPPDASSNAQGAATAPDASPDAQGACKAPDAPSGASRGGERVSRAFKRRDALKTRLGYAIP